MITSWTYGWNRPGYMPDCDPVECDTWQEARDALQWEVERWDEVEHLGQTSEALDNAAALIAGAELEAPFVVMCGDYALWVERSDA